MISALIELARKHCPQLRPDLLTGLRFERKIPLLWLWRMFADYSDIEEYCLVLAVSGHEGGDIEIRVYHKKFSKAATNIARDYERLTGRKALILETAFSGAPIRRPLLKFIGILLAVIGAFCFLRLASTAIVQQLIRDWFLS